MLPLLEALEPRWRNSREARAALPALLAGFGRYPNPEETAGLEKILAEIDPDWKANLKESATKEYLAKLTGNGCATCILAKVDPEWMNTPAAQERVPELIEMLDAEDQNTRRQAARVLGDYGPAAKEALPRLRKEYFNHPRNDHARELYGKVIFQIDGNEYQKLIGRGSGSADDTGPTVGTFVLLLIFLFLAIVVLLRWKMDWAG